MKKLVVFFVLICMVSFSFISCNAKAKLINKQTKSSSASVNSISQESTSLLNSNNTNISSSENSKIASSIVNSSSKKAVVSSSKKPSISSSNSSSKKAVTSSSPSSIITSSQIQNSSNAPTGKGKIINYSFTTYCDGLLLYGNGDVYSVNHARKVTDTTCKYDTYTKMLSNARYIFSYNCNIVITKSNELYVWGGLMPTEGDNKTPRLLMSDVKSAIYKYIITNNGDLYVYGDFRTKDLNTDKYNINNPKKILSNINSVSYDGSTTLALTNNGDLLKWDNVSVSSFIDDNSKGLISTTLYSGVKTFSSCQSDYCFITNTNDLYCCGVFTDIYNQDFSYPTPVKVASNVKSVSFICSLAYITYDNELYYFGETPLKIADNIRYVNSYYGAVYIDNNNNLYHCGSDANKNVVNKFIKDNCLIATSSPMSFVELTNTGELYLPIVETDVCNTSKVIFD